MDELTALTIQLVKYKRQLEDITRKYYDVKRQNEERAEIINDLLLILEVDNRKLREVLEKRYNSGKE